MCCAVRRRTCRQPKAASFMQSALRAFPPCGLPTATLADVAEEEVLVSMARPTDYNCVLEVVDSDHKPVYALLQVQLPGYDQVSWRRVWGGKADADTQGMSPFRFGQTALWGPRRP